MITDRIDHITNIAPSHRHVAPPAPRSVKIELSAKCNFRCGFCALRTRKVQPTQDMPLDFFKRITQEMRDAGVAEIGCFYLGESSLAPALLIAAVEHCKRIGFPYVFLTTNGSAMTPALMTQIMRAGLDSLKFSMNAADEAQFEAVMGAPAKLFRQAVKHIRHAKGVREQVGSKCGIYASSIRYDGEQQTRMEAFLARDVLPFVDQHYWLPLYSMGSVATQREEELGFRPTAGNQGRIGAMRDPLPCWSAFTEGHVTADGGLSACCFDADSRWKMGDLHTQTFMEAWNSQQFQALRAAHLAKDVTGTPCQECVAYSDGPLP